MREEVKPLRDCGVKVYYADDAEFDDDAVAEVVEWLDDGVYCLTPAGVPAGSRVAPADHRLLWNELLTAGGNGAG